MDGRKNNNATHLKKRNMEKKKPITIYETGEDIKLLGGLDAVRKLLKTAISIAIVDKNNLTR